MTDQLPIDPIRTPWRTRDMVGALLAGFFVSAVAYVAVAPDPTVLELFAVVYPAQWAGTLGVVAALAPRRAEWRSELRVAMVARDLWGVPQGALIQIGLSLIAYLVVVELLDGSAPTQDVVDSAAAAIGGLERVLVVVGLGVIGPITEEIVFRGILLRVLEPRGRGAAIVISSLVFAGLHLLDPGAVIAVPFLFVLGIVLAHRTLATGRLGPAIAMHVGFNLITIVALFSA